MKALVVERAGADEADFLHGREQQFDPRVRPAVLEDAARAVDHRRRGCLVVGAEDRAACVANDAFVVHYRIDGTVRGDGVEMRAEEERRPFRDRLEPRVDVPHRGADPRSHVVLVRVEPEGAKGAQDAVGDGALLPRRTRDRGKLKK